MFDEIKPKKTRKQAKTELKIASLGETPPVDNLPERAPKLKLPIIERDLVDWMEGSLLPYSPKETAFDNNFHVFRLPNGRCELLKESADRTIVIIEKEREFLANAIVRAIWRFTPAGSCYQVTFKQALQIAALYMHGTKKSLSALPKPVVFKSANELAFARLGFDPAIEYTIADFPKLNEVLSRITNSKSICAKVGQMLTPNTPRKQSIWLYGQADSGKSLLMRILAKICGGKAGTAFCSPRSLKSPHFKESLLGKKLLVCNEAQAEFLRSDDYKALLGDRDHDINPKGKTIYNAELECHGLFNSNEPPEVPNEDFMRNRLIVCHITKVPDDKFVREEVLEPEIDAELPAFVAYCLDMYKPYLETGVIIPEDNTKLEEAISDFEDPLLYVFEKCFDLAATEEEKKSFFVSAGDLRTVIDKFKDPKEGITVSKMRKFIRNKYQIEGVRNRDHGPNIRYYPGIKLKFQPIPWPHELE